MFPIAARAARRDHPGVAHRPDQRSLWSAAPREVITRPASPPAVVRRDEPEPRWKLALAVASGAAVTLTLLGLLALIL